MLVYINIENTCKYPICIFVYIYIICIYQYVYGYAKHIGGVG